MRFPRAIASGLFAFLVVAYAPIASADREIDSATSCSKNDSKLCAGNGASCDVVYDRDNNASAVCRWASATDAAACKSTNGLWTTAESKYGRNHPDAVAPGSDGACITEVRNVPNKKSDALAVTQPTGAEKQGPYKRPPPVRRSRNRNYTQQLDIDEFGGCKYRNHDHQIVVFAGADYFGSCAVLGFGTYNDALSMHFPDNSISSILIGDNVEVLVCKKENLNGDCWLMNGSHNKMGLESGEWLGLRKLITGARDFDNAITSIRVTRTDCSNKYAAGC